jgi:type I restriction enzyme, S subunit
VTISELPVGWATEALGGLGRWVGGGTPSKTNSEYWMNGTVPWLSPKDMKSTIVTTTIDRVTEAAVVETTIRKVPRGSIAFVVRSGILTRVLPVALLEIETTVNQDIRVLVPSPEIDARWLLYALLADANDIRGACQKDGTTVASLDVQRLMSWSVMVPPRPEQERITSKVDVLLNDADAAGELLDDARALLPAYLANSVRDVLFGVFTSGAADGETGAELLARIAAARATAPKRRKKRVKDPEAPADIPNLPQGWAWARWQTIGDSQNGRAFPSADYGDEGVRLLRPGNLHGSGEVVWTNDNTRHLPETYAEEFPGFVVGGREIVMNLTAQSLRDDFLGRVCMTGVDERCLLNQRIARLTPVLMNPEFVFWVFKSSWFRQFVATLNKGSLIQHIFTSEVDEFWLPVPSLHEQESIVETIAKVVEQVAALELAIQDSQADVDGLRHRILGAARDGNLVEQDEADEPAQLMLDRVRLEVEAAGRAKKPRSLTKTGKS